MSKIAFLFPGQGAQYLGMGKDIIDAFEESKEVFEKGKQVLDFDLEEVCFKDEEKIHRTDFTQPALLVTSVAILKAVEKLSIKPDYVAGLSLGEYSALVANGALSLENATKLVRKRGLFMESAAKSTKGSMAAVLRSRREEVKSICDSIDGVINIANYNSPKQLVIAGEINALNEAIDKLKKEGIKVIPLKVSGAFHSPLMLDAAQQLEKELEAVDLEDFQIPYVTNVTGSIVNKKHDIKDLLVKQVQGSVMWEDSIRTLIDEGVELFVEIGPGRTLSGLVKKIDKTKKIINVENLDSLKQLEAHIKGV